MIFDLCYLNGQQTYLFLIKLKSQMYFGIGPFGIGFGMNNQQQPPIQQQPQQPNRFFNQQEQPGFRPNNQNNNPGFFNGFNNFINNNFMNPFFENHANRPNNNQQEPQPTFFRKSNKREDVNPPKQEGVYNQSSAMFWKNKGNEAYQFGKFDLAISYYTKAIEINSTESVFYSNRAQCLKKLGRIEQALKDAQEAIELDSNNARGHMIAGQLLAEIGKIQDSTKKVESAIVRLTKALTLCGGKKLQLEKEISRYIYLAKKLLFYLRFNLVRNSRIDAVKQYKEYLQKDQKLQGEFKQSKMNSFIQASNQPVIFSIPDYLQCRITMELMEDPVVTDSGQTYERQAIEMHMEKNGKTDPFTRKPIKGPLYPNISIRKAVQDFLERNPWAYEYIQGENYKTIAF